MTWLSGQVVERQFLGVLDQAVDPQPPRTRIDSDESALVLGWEIDDFDQTTYAVDTSTGNVISELPGVVGVVPTPDPDVVVAVNDHGRTIGLHDLAAGEPIGTPVAPGFRIYSVWATEGRVLAANWHDPAVTGINQVSWPFRLQGFDPDTGRLVGPTIESAEWMITDVAFAADAMYTETVDDGFRLERRDLDTGELLGAPAAGFSQPATGGGILVANATDGRILQLDPITLEPVGSPFPGVTGPARDLALDRDGRLLMVRGEDNLLRVYDVASRTQLGDPIDLDHPGPLSQFDHPWAAIPFAECGAEGCRGMFRRPHAGLGAAIRPDGLEVAATFVEGIVVWDLDPAGWIADACQLAGRNLTRGEWDQYIGDLAPYRPTCPEHEEA